MKKRFSFILLLIIHLLLSPYLYSGNNVPAKVPVISGYIRDANTGEVLIAANVYIKEFELGTVSNSYGFYSISLAQGKYTIGFSYIGFSTTEREITLNDDVILNIDLSKDLKLIEEVEIRAVKKNNNITSLETGTNQLTIQTINKIPALFGEIDIIKAIQLLPGVQSTSEGSSGFSVRGGASDQNLVLLDEATVYNGSHLMGFFSIFNNDAIKDVKLFKGDIPASSGGRLSSLLDVRMKDGNIKKFSGSGGVGILSSRLTLEGPVVKDKTSFIVSGRRTYADIFLPLAKNEDVRDNKLYFYDINAKLNQIINEKNKIFLSGYFGRDIFKNQFAGIGFGNSTITLRWNHLFSGKLFSNFSLINSNYKYELGTPGEDINSFRWNSELKDNSFKADFSYYLNPESTIKFGLISTYHHILPGTAQGIGPESLFTKFVLPDNFSLEHGIYTLTEKKLNAKLSMKLGLRLSLFQNIGKATIYNYNKSYEVIDSTVYNFAEFFNTYLGLEPRFGLTYILTDVSSLKLSFNRTRQYMQLAQNSTAGTPLDVWFSSGPNIKPQVSDQISVGYFRNFNYNKIETSIEAYYKKMNNTIDFKDHASLLLNPLLEGEVRSGKAFSYGIEFLIQLSQSRLSGWIAYTLSKTERKIREINNGNPYPAPYDKPNNLAFVLNYQLNKRIIFGTNWIYNTGNPVTFPTGRYEILGSVIPVYSKRNAYRMPAYHRLDLSVTISGKEKPEKKWRGDWNFSVYNAYGRKNAWSINFIQDETDPSFTFAEKTYLFSIIPAVSYNFKF